ncbi:hypothetical protein GCM10012286_41370 [Streptomyces lasiicapitis]|uniref:Uncharacterized protein n=1 Tax=Streptomyces lasiicapitis TaxID=1923961 RepID=A0ABQ2M6D8_9ACTN|nr:hypothetical protein GCM10012286_41370 [Streptomyces lasiicapitis]
MALVPWPEALSERHLVRRVPKNAGFVPLGNHRATRTVFWVGEQPTASPSRRDPGKKELCRM